MKYAEKFPDMIPVLDELEGVIRLRTPRACHVCRRITEYLDVSYGVPMCSEECLDRLERMIEEEIDSRLTQVEDPDGVYYSFPF